MPLVYFSEAEDIIAEIGKVTELHLRLRERGPLPTEGFPMIIRDTSPVELIELYERISNAPLYYDQEKGGITELKPEGSIDIAIDWMKQKTATLAP